MINYEDASYQYPNAQELKRITQKINYLHQLGQGKIVTLYELARNTLSEVQLNLNNFKDILGIDDSYATLAKFAALLWNIQLVFQNSDPSKKIANRHRVEHLIQRFKEEKKVEPANKSEIEQMKEMQKKVTYL